MYGNSRSDGRTKPTAVSTVSFNLTVRSQLKFALIKWHHSQMKRNQHNTTHMNAFHHIGINKQLNSLAFVHSNRQRNVEIIDYTIKLTLCKCRLGCMWKHMHSNEFYWLRLMLNVLFRLFLFSFLLSLFFALRINLVCAKQQPILLVIRIPTGMMWRMTQWQWRNRFD